MEENKIPNFQTTPDTNNSCTTQTNILQHCIIKFIVNSLKENPNWLPSLNDLYFCYNSIMEDSTNNGSNGNQDFKEWVNSQTVNFIFSTIAEAFKEYENRKSLERKAKVN